MAYYVYILTNETNVVLYTGVTNNLLRRLQEHIEKHDKNSFTAKYNIHKLVYYEYTDSIDAAIEREKQIKTWNRKRKNRLIDSCNPDWHNLITDLIT